MQSLKPIVYSQGARRPAEIWTENLSLPLLIDYHELIGSVVLLARNTYLAAKWRKAETSIGECRTSCVTQDRQDQSTSFAV